MSEDEIPGNWNDRQRKFVEEYLVDRIASRAALRAGYEPSAIKQTASRLMNDPAYVHVQQAIRERLEAEADRYQALKDRIILERCRVAFSDPADLVDEAGKWLPVHEVPEHARAAIQEVKESTFLGTDGQPQVQRRVKLWSKNEALTALEKVTGLTKDRVEHSGGINLSAARADLDAIIRGLGPPEGEPGGEGGEES